MGEVKIQKVCTNDEGWIKSQTPDDVKYWYINLLKHNPDSIIVADPAGYITYVNPACERTMGLSADKLCGNHLLDLALPHDHMWVDAVDVCTQGKVVTGESKIGGKDCTHVYVQYRFVPIVNDSRTLGIQVILKDLTKDARAKDELLRTKEKLQAIFDALDISLWSEHFPTKSMTYISPGSEKVWGIPQHELESNNIAPYVLIHPDDIGRVKDQMMGVYEGKTVIQDVRIIRSDGEVRWIHDQVTPKMDEQGQLVDLMGVTIDITELKTAEEQHAKAREMLQRSEKLSTLGQLAAGIAHEIRNPLTSVMGFMQLIKPLIPGVYNYTDVMMSELGRISDIIAEFLMLAKPQSMKLDVQDIKSIVADIVSLFHSEALIHNISLVTEIDPLVPNIHCDKSQVKQILINLIKNAVEAMPTGGIISINVSVHEDDKLLIRITDKGPGIPSDILSKIGEPFFTTKQGGTGLGMMITNQLIENHGGKFLVESKIDHGTTVSVILPIMQHET